mgnify:CR=1 FL=1
MKAILVIEMPSRCIDCPCHFAEMNTVVCGVNKEQLLTDDIETHKPDWCPLKPMPKKKKERYSMNRQTSTGHWETYGEETDSVAVGYNACIDEILGDKE